MNAIIKGDIAHNRSYGLASTASITPYYFNDGNKNRFIVNLIERTVTVKERGIDKQQRIEVAERLLNLRKNNFKFLKFYCSVFDNPIDFLKWVIEDNKTLQIHGELFKNCKESNFVDFHGNLIESSCSFMFRIYDTDLLNTLKEMVKTCKKRYHYKN